MRIKKHPSGNEYILASGLWVRNFVKPCTRYLSVNDMFSREDMSLVLKNSELNKNRPKIASESIFFRAMVIVSDGYRFPEKHLWLGGIPKDVGILAVNSAARRWKLVSPDVPPERRRTINAYVVNNPYPECLAYLPENKYYPTCIASARTNSDFVGRYPGDVYLYSPTPEEGFGYEVKERYCIDDYRNPVCAAVGLAYNFGARKVLLLCCDDSFAECREGSVALPNGLHTYPQQIMSQETLDANLYWLTSQQDREVAVANCSEGIKLKNALYIQSEKEVGEFLGE